MGLFQLILSSLCSVLLSLFGISSAPGWVISLLAGLDTLNLAPRPQLYATSQAGFAWASARVFLKFKSGISFLFKKTCWQFPTAHKISSSTSMRHSSSPHPGLWLLASWGTSPGFTLYIPVIPNWWYIPMPNISHHHALDRASSLS